MSTITSVLRPWPGKISLCLAALLIHGGLAAARPDAAQPGAARPDAARPDAAEKVADTVADIVEVQLVELDVRVSDDDGEPIYELEAEDFQLFVDGEEAEIDFFEAPRRPSLVSTSDGTSDGEPNTQALAQGAEPDDGTFIVIYADLGLLEAGDLGQIRPRLDAFLAQQLPADAKAMLIVADEGLRIASPMGTDRESMRQQLARLDGSDEGGQLALAYRTLLRDLRRARSSIEQEINFRDPLLIAQRRDAEGDVDNPGIINTPDAQTVAADGFLPPQRLARDVQRSLGNDLRVFFERVQRFHEAADRHLLRTSDHLRRLTRMVAGLPGSTHLIYLGRRLPTGAPAELFKAWQDETVDLIRNTRSLASEDFEQRQAALDGLEVAEADIAPFRDGGHLIARAALDASALGVTLHTIELSSKDRSRRFNKRSGKFDESALQSGNLRQGAAEIAEIDALAALALLSGGRSWRPDEESEPFLDRLGRSLTSGYVLGIALPGSGDLRQVEVRLSKKAKRTLDYRRTLEVRSLDAQAADLVLAALTTGLADNGLGFELSVPETIPTSAEESVRLPVRLRVPLAKLALVPDGHVHVARLAIYTCAGGLERGTTPVRKAEVPVRIRNSELLTALGRHVEVDVELDVPPTATGRIAVVVRDEYRPTMSTLTSDLPPAAIVAPASGAAASD